MNCCVEPFTIDGFAGVTPIDVSVAAVTVRTVEPLTLPKVALIVEVPVPTPLAKPPAVIVATLVVADAHVTLVVMFCVVESLYVPVAVNCRVKPFAIDGFAGVTLIDVSVAAVMVRVVEPLMVPEVALIVEVPTPTPFARPPLVMVATLVVAELQVTELVIICVVPLL